MTLSVLYMCFGWVALLLAFFFFSADGRLIQAVGFLVMAVGSFLTAWFNRKR